MNTNRIAPPPASLRERRGSEVWVCYYCNRFFIPADFQTLGEREVWTCQNCGHIQVLGKDERIREAARAADAEQPIAGNRADGVAVQQVHVPHDMRKLTAALEQQRQQKRDRTTNLPADLDRAMLTKIQSAYDLLKAKHNKAPKAKVAATANTTRSTVDKYWSHIKK